MQKEYFVQTNNKSITQVQTIFKDICDCEYKVVVETLWRGGNVTVFLTDDDYDDYNKKQFNINNYNFKINGLYGVVNKTINILKDYDILEYGILYDSIMRKINENGFDYLEGEDGWEYMDNDYTINGKVTLQKVTISFYLYAIYYHCHILYVCKIFFPFQVFSSLKTLFGTFQYHHSNRYLKPKNHYYVFLLLLV